MAILVSVHQIGIPGKVLKPSEVSLGEKVELKKVKGILSDFLIEVRIKNEILGYVSEVSLYTLKGTQVLSEELYNEIPESCEGTLKEIQEKILPHKTHYLFIIEISK